MKKLLIAVMLIMTSVLLGNYNSYAGEKVYLKKGEFGKYSNLSKNKDLYVIKKNGTYDDRANDLEELCKDWIYYRDKIVKFARAGDNPSAAKARVSFNDVNRNLAEYNEKDVTKMFSLIEKSGYKSPGGN